MSEEIKNITEKEEENLVFVGLAAFRDTMKEESIELLIKCREMGMRPVIVTEESVCIQTAGKIKYVSDNVSIVDKKLARALEAGKGHPAFVLYK